MELAPTYSHINENIIDGDFLRIPKWCVKHYGEKCKRFYQNVTDVDTFYICPFGFTTYCKKVGTTNVIYTCLRVRGKYNKKKVLPKIKDEIDSYEFTIERFYEFIEKSISYNNRHYDLQSKIDTLESKVKKLNENNESIVNLTNNTLHEIRSLNKTLKSQVEDIMQTTSKYVIRDDDDFFGFRIRNINATSNLISTRLSSYDILNNPNVIDKSLRKKICVHNKFYKTKQLLTTYFHYRKVTISLTGVSYSEIMSSDIFEVLPYILYENYIKYSLEGTQVLTEFSESDTEISVKISGLGPTLIDDEHKHIFEKGFRGRNAVSLGTTGSGIGLYIAKMICDILNIRIEIISEDKIERTKNKIPYSYFKVLLFLPIHNKKYT